VISTGVQMGPIGWGSANLKKIDVRLISCEQTASVAY
jgi:hypothetical protein